MSQAKLFRKGPQNTAEDDVVRPTRVADTVYDWQLVATTQLQADRATRWRKQVSEKSVEVSVLILFSL